MLNISNATSFCIVNSSGSPSSLATLAKPVSEVEGDSTAE